MKLMLRATATAAGLLLAAGQAGAVTITFEDLAEGSVLSNQYAALGAVFVPNVHTGLTAPNGAWATNTDMTVTATDVSILGTPVGTVSGKMLHAYGSIYGGWNADNGDPSFAINFSTPVTFVSAAFGGVSVAADVHLVAYSGATMLADITSTVTTGQYVLSYAGANITSVVITPGSFSDWVAVDNINFTPSAVPEVSTYAMMALGMGLIAFKRRKAA